MTLPIVGPAPTPTASALDNKFGIEPFNLTCMPQAHLRAGAENRLALEEQLARFHLASSRIPVWARANIGRGKPEHLLDECGRVDVPSLLRDFRKDYHQLQVDWDGTRLAVAVSYDEGVLTKHWRPLSRAQERQWLDWVPRGGRVFGRMASSIVEQPAPVFEVAMTLAMHTWQDGRPGDFDVDDFAPALEQVTAWWPAGGIDLVAFAQLADGWSGTTRQLLYAAVALRA